MIIIRMENLQIANIHRGKAYLTIIKRKFYTYYGHNESTGVAVDNVNRMDKAF